jgi:hypothetical protein
MRPNRPARKLRLIERREPSMACASDCRDKTAQGAAACRRRCGSSARRLATMLEPDLAGYALIGAQIEMLASLGTDAQPRL